MTVLAKSAILVEMNKPKGITVTPLLDAAQIGPSSIDVRLGKEFIIFKKSRRQVIDCEPQYPSNNRNTIDGERSSWKQDVHEFQERVRLDLNSEFVLHPNELILASTLEYIATPEDIFASVEGKSTIGRLGLLVATATAIAPGYSGCITLEVINEGEIPIVVRPGQLIAQIVFFRTSGVGHYEGRYMHPIGPEFPSL